MARMNQTLQYRSHEDAEEALLVLMADGVVQRRHRVQIVERQTLSGKRRYQLSLPR